MAHVNYVDKRQISLHGHLTSEIIAQLDQNALVIGTLPIHLAAQVCDSGARFMTIELNVPPELRGSELSREQLEAFGAKLVEYHIARINR